MLFLIVKEIQEVNTVLTVALRFEQDDEKNIDEDGVIKDLKLIHTSKLWLRFFPLDYSNKGYYGAEYQDVIKKAREKHLDDLAILVLNKTEFAIDVINLLIENDPKKPPIKNFCIFPRDCLAPESTNKENSLWFKAIKACDCIARIFSKGLEKNNLEKHDLIKHLLGENAIIIKPNIKGIEGEHPKEKVKQHHEMIEKYLTDQEFTWIPFK